MKIEVGVDIVEVARIKKLVDKNHNFVKRVFSDNEIAYCKSHKRYAEHFAVRFAAKEAVIKALGVKEIPLINITIAHLKSGKPVIKLSDKWKKYESFLAVSLAHCSNYAVAYVVFYK